MLKNKRIEKMIHSTNYKNKYSTILILAVVIVLSLVFFTKFLMNKINEISTRTQELIADQENNIKMLSQLHGIREQYNEISPDIPILNEFFKENEIVGLVTLLEGIASDTRNSIEIEVFEDNRISTQKSKEGSGEKLIEFPEDQIIRIGVNLSGEYDRMVEFVQKLKGIKYYNDIESINISVQETERVVRRVRPSSVFQKEEGESQEGEQTQEEIEIKGGINTELVVVFYLENKKTGSK